ncbi:hypothetical protein ACQJBY_060826 [Aegilops geniculata]
MGSFLSSAAGAAGEVDHAARSHRAPTIKECTRHMTNQELARLDGYDPVSFQELVAAGRPTLLQDEADSAAVCKLVRCALKHYNSKNPLGRRLRVSRRADHGDEGHWYQFQGTFLVPRRFLGTPEECWR